MLNDGPFDVTISVRSVRIFKCILQLEIDDNAI